METKELLIATPTKCISMVDFLASGGELKIGMKVAYKIAHFNNDDTWIFQPNEIPMLTVELDQFRIDQINQLGEDYIKHHNFHVLQEENSIEEYYDAVDENFVLKVSMIAKQPLKETIFDVQCQLGEEEGLQDVEKIIGFIILSRYVKEYNLDLYNKFYNAE
jgi:hypothetical protein